MKVNESTSQEERARQPVMQVLEKEEMAERAEEKQLLPSFSSGDVLAITLVCAQQ